MPWYELSSADDSKLNELAEKYHLHPLHLEDSRSADERVKVEQTPTYTFAVLKPLKFDKNSPNKTDAVSFSTIDIFAGNHEGEPFFITIADPDCPAAEEALARARREGS